MKKLLKTLIITGFIFGLNNVYANCDAKMPYEMLINCITIEASNEADDDIQDMLVDETNTQKNNLKLKKEKESTPQLVQQD